MTHALLSALTHASLLTTTERQQVNLAAEQNGTGVHASLIDTGLFTDRELARHLAHLFSLPLTDVHQYDYQSLCLQLALRPLIERHRVLPLSQDQDVLYLGIADPTETQCIDECRFITGLSVRPLLLPLQQLEHAIQRVYGQQITSTLTTAPVRSDEFVSQDALPEVTAEPDTQEDAPVSRYLNQLLLDAIRRKASDIHIEPFEQNCHIRFRCDGLLLRYASPPPEFAVRLVARLKILARLNIAERRLPQDGRFRLPLSQDLTVDMRLSTIPAQWGEKAVLRLLDHQHVPLSFEHLGLTAAQQHALQEVLDKPQGLVLVTGPTGSGKTQSLYAGLNYLNQEHRNLCTAEDPVEIQLTGVNQLQINPAIGLDFSSALRSFLRQDPDVMMIGEIRDQETATMAIRAAQTGHLVLSTLHTNSAADTLNRLRHLGVTSYDLGTSLSLIIAQRLVRCLCPHCKQAGQVPPFLQPHLPADTATLFVSRPQGCERCNQGYLGRTGLFELCLPEKQRTDTAPPTPLMRYQCVAQHTLTAAGLRLLSEGTTSVSELQRVIGLDDLQTSSGEVA
ncbi:GspE/PulE family protein [Photobacterium sp. 1_MG-2023]|uniref:GspE/PulE family protein n=1 Tax=Photobacterium sp. 1_MG-2023 TaxID=3062646 RepID=UPI0026E3249E|nr:ATPase, T2SS/T4P/T4SS family [Photobacterium sp. 1_MG-2023]MDO6706460.1 ATPase, T2SS/T4P/T4SS family [Photobacterium sp. 1_MG-2023]